MTPEKILAVAAVASVVVAGAGVCVAWIQLGGIRSGLKMSSLMAVLEIETQMNERKARFNECSFSIKEAKADGRSADAIKLLAERFDVAKESYFNSLDRLCFCIIKGHLADKDWRAEYRDVISNCVKAHPDDFNEASPFRNIKDLNNRWQRE